MRNVLKVASNLAVLEAKIGRRNEATEHIERATRTVHQFPSRQLEFFVAYSRGTVFHLFGDTERAVETFDTAIEIGRRLGDDYLTNFADVTLAECDLFSGRYQRAVRSLRRLSRKADEAGTPIFSRMAYARLFLVEMVLGRRRRAERARAALRRIVPTDVTYLEAWNDVAIGAAQFLAGESATEPATAALTVFSKIGAPAGRGFAELLLLVDALLRKDADTLTRLVAAIGGNDGVSHRFLAVARPIACAAECSHLGQVENADRHLAEAAGAIVGSPFLELDWTLETLHARIARDRKRFADARRHVHRAMHSRDLVLQLIPIGAREGFLGHRRFRDLADLEASLKSPPVEEYGSTRRMRGPQQYLGIVGRSAPMLQIFQMIEKLRDQELPVLITGETGTGKDLVARALYRRSQRGDGRFLAVHCASLPSELFEAELFGYQAGAFTGADHDQPGLLEALERGTVLLDGVSHLSTECQAKLLRVLDSGVIRRLGSAAESPIDVRFLTASSINLHDAVEVGTFRADLYHRLRGVELVLPPLRERSEDIESSARTFLDRHAALLDVPLPHLESGAIELLKHQEWKGNVRELEAVLLRALLELSRPTSIGAAEVERFLGPTIEAPSAAKRDLLNRDLDNLKEELEREYLTRLFLEVRGEPEAMMARLGVKRSKLYAWFRRLEVDVWALRRELRG